MKVRTWKSLIIRLDRLMRPAEKNRDKRKARARRAALQGAFLAYTTFYFHLRTF